MLVMTRRQGETILIGDDIEIVIAHIGRSRVKVGIRAPRTVPVVAREVKLVREQNLAAAAVAPSLAELSGLIARLQPASGSSQPQARMSEPGPCPGPEQCSAAGPPGNTETLVLPACSESLDVRVGPKKEAPAGPVR